MKGASGAFVNLNGDRVSKICNDALLQVEWFGLAAQHGLVAGVRVPAAELLALREYHMEFIRGHCATSEPSVMFLETLLKQVMVWRDSPPQTAGSWDSYIERLEEHVKIGDTGEMREALSLVQAAEQLPASFCHGDFTLENILIESDGTCVLLDPNYKRGLFQSYVLDLGKLLQSTHARYHEVFRSNHGVDLRRHDEWLLERLKALGLWQESLIACITHVMRLRKYRPEEEKFLADEMLLTLIKEYRQ